MGTWEIHHAENLDPVQGLGRLADGSVDAVITDPPYSRHVHDCSRRGITGYREAKGEGPQSRRMRALGFAALTPEERTAVSVQFARLVRRWVLVFCDHEGSTAWANDLRQAGLEYVRTCLWIKVGCTPQLTGDRPANGHECIVVAHQTRAGKPVKKRWNAGGKRGIYSHPIVLDRAHAGTRVHTTQKPLDLMRELVSDFSDPGELICDPYAGSGTTGVACSQLGRRFVGWERDSNYAAIARRRLAGLRGLPDPRQPDLFDDDRGPAADQLEMFSDNSRASS